VVIATGDLLSFSFGILLLMGQSQDIEKPLLVKLQRRTRNIVYDTEKSVPSTETIRNSPNNLTFLPTFCIFHFLYDRPFKT
jgi:hypothetical protein